MNDLIHSLDSENHPQPGHVVQGGRVGNDEHRSGQIDGPCNGLSPHRHGDTPPLTHSEWVDPPHLRVDRPAIQAALDGSRCPGWPGAGPHEPTSTPVPSGLARQLGKELGKQLGKRPSELVNGLPAESLDAPSNADTCAAPPVPNGLPVGGPVEPAVGGHVDSVVSPVAIPSAAQADLTWLIRLAQRTPSARARIQRLQDTTSNESPEQWLRSLFTPAAWRLICRSDPKNFQPILKCTQFRLYDLRQYVDALIATGWQEAPQGRWLDALIVQSYYYFNSRPELPEDKSDFALMWIAQRDGIATLEGFLTLHDWAFRAEFDITRSHTWRSLWRRAEKWMAETEALAVTRQSEPWHFYCGPTDWQGLEIVPLTTPYALWVEGRAMHSCLYSLASECEPDRDHRFFSVRRDGKRVATLELEHIPPPDRHIGTVRRRGCWRLVDCRRSCNLLVDSRLITTLKAFAAEYTRWSNQSGPVEDTARNTQPPEARPSEGPTSRQEDDGPIPNTLPPNPPSPNNSAPNNSALNTQPTVPSPSILKLNPPVYRPWPGCSRQGAGEGRSA